VDEPPAKLKHTEKSHNDVHDFCLCDIAIDVFVDLQNILAVGSYRDKHPSWFRQLFDQSGGEDRCCGSYMNGVIRASRRIS
jgi:hypothetical protein